MNISSVVIETRLPRGSSMSFAAAAAESEKGTVVAASRGQGVHRAEKFRIAGEQYLLRRDC